MTKKRTWIAVLLAAMLVAVCMFAACFKQKFAVKWTVDDHATVVAEGYDKLPEEVEEGTQLTFTVTPAENYEIAAVKAGGKAITADQAGKYTVKVTAETTIEVTAAKQIERLDVVFKDETKAYFAGDTVAKEDLEVTVVYKTSDQETVTDYTIEYTNGSAFAEGDTSFTVKYGGMTQSVTVAEVAAKTFDVTEVELKACEGGKPCYVVRGTYAHYTREEFEKIGFDFQNNGNYDGGNWTYHVVDVTVDTFADGQYEISVDLAQLLEKMGDSKDSCFLPHMGFGQHQDNGGNLDVKTETFSGGPIDYQGAVFTLTNQSSYDMVGVIIKKPLDPNEKVFNINSTINLAKDEGAHKMYAVISGVYQNYTEEEFRSNYTFDYTSLSWQATPFTQEQITITFNSDGTFEVRLDITAIPAGEYLLHYSVGTETGKDIGNENGIAAIALGDKSYSYQKHDFDTWSRFVLTIEEQADADNGASHRMA